MALGSPQFDSYLQQPQQNQYLTGNPSTDTNAQTDWMEPSGGLKAPTNPIDNTGINGGAQQPSSTTTPAQAGTLLGSIGAGNNPIGTFMPGGYDQNKWNDPNKHDPKYDVGRILSQYQPGTPGLDQAFDQQLKAQGYTRVGKDSIFRPDVGVVDVGRAFGSGQGAWDWMPQDMSSGQPSFMDNQQQGGQQNIMQWLQQLFGQGNNPSNNSTGGYAQPIMRPQQQQQGPNQMGPIPNFQYGSSINPNAMTDQGQYGGNMPISPYNPNMGSYFNQQPGFSYIAPYGPR